MIDLKSIKVMIMSTGKLTKCQIDCKENLKSPKSQSKVLKLSSECTIPPDANNPTICSLHGHISKCQGSVNVGSDNYRRASTKQANFTIKECAETLNNSDIIAMLAFGDMHCQDLIYHTSCHIALMNEANAFQKKKQADLNAKEQSLEYLNQHVESIVLSEIVIEIEERVVFQTKAMHLQTCL